MTDWYMVVQEHCRQHGVVGDVVQVATIEPAHPEFYLRCHCGARYAQNKAHALIVGDAYHPLEWLRKQPPIELVQDLEKAEA